MELYEDEVLIFPERRQHQQPHPSQQRRPGLLPPRHPGPATANNGSSRHNIRPKAAFPITADAEVEEAGPRLGQQHSFCLAVPVSSSSGSRNKPQQQQKTRRLYLAPEEEAGGAGVGLGAGEAEVERLAWMELMGAAISIAR